VQRNNAIPFFFIDNAWERTHSITAGKVLYDKGNAGEGETVVDDKVTLDPGDEGFS
jgi:hypothetical protein